MVVNYHDTVVSWYQKEKLMPNQSEQKVDESKDKKEPKFQIQIDRVHYTITKEVMTGAELRHVPPAPIGSDRDLFEVVPGAPDRKIGDNDTVEIRDGERFFTAPAHINPGAFKQ
jgi:hypothetical protein